MESNETGNFGLNTNKDKLNSISTKSYNNGAQMNDFDQNLNEGIWNNDSKKYISLLCEYNVTLKFKDLHLL